MDDAELVRQTLQGNRAAYGRLVDKYAAQIAALCRSYLGRRDGVEDLVQETFFSGLDRLADLRKPEKFGSWLYQIARNLCKGWHQQQHRRPVPLEDVGDVPDDEPPDGCAELQVCIERLPPDLREILLIYYSAERITYRELADRLGISYALVNSRLTEARKRLRTCLGVGEPPITSPPG